ncbi:gasdermin-A [Alligator sinensis]|uniref:Gasdermin-A n=1 Tax=Alligator sinensis TaxID=38654 RepID=A0A1U7RME5_ALLSI|nr:gasdermin-A [Alligator sinensis]
MFHRETKFLAKQLDSSGKLIPVYSINDQEHFKPLCLVQGKEKDFFWKSERYYRTEFKISDVLVPGHYNKNLDVQDAGSVRVEHTVDGSVEGNINFENVEVKGLAKMSQERSINMKKTFVSVQVLESLQRERKINMEHSFITQLKNQRRNLYVIHEAVHASEETTFKDSNRLEGSIIAQIYVKLHGARNSKRDLTIPKDCVLAFRVMPLIIEDGSWNPVYVPTKKTKTFARDGVSEEGIGDPQKEVEQKCEVLTALSADLSAKFFNCIKTAIKNINLLQELVLELEWALDNPDAYQVKTENPDLRDLLQCLPGTTTVLFLDLAGAILYVAHALDELTEDQLLLVYESMERKILPPQLELVKNILKQDFHQNNGAFHLDAKLLSSLKEEQLNITKAMIEISGVMFQIDGPFLNGIGNPDDSSALAALYVVLCILHLLTKSK